MATTRLTKKEREELADLDIDDLLSKLSAEDIEELGQELIDPDVSFESTVIRKFHVADKG